MFKSNLRTSHASLSILFSSGDCAGEKTKLQRKPSDRFEDFADVRTI